LVDFFFVKISFGLQLFDLLQTLLLVTGQLQFLFVAPKHVWLSLNTGLGQHVMQVSNLVEATIAYNNEHAPVILFHAIFYEYPDSLVNFLFHLWCVVRKYYK
jgi:hypothetical protein